MKITNFQELTIWKESVRLTKDVYSITNKAEFSKDFALRDQVRRAMISISSNIVEGFERNNNNEFIRFLLIAKGSAGEARSQLIIAHEIGYLNKDDSDKFQLDLIKLINQIGKMISYLMEKRRNNEFKQTR